MANGTTRFALSKMQMEGQDGAQQHEYLKEIQIEKVEDRVGGKPGRQSKISLKNPSEHNHSK